MESATLRGSKMTEWDYIFERDWNKYSINAILERKKKWK